MVLGVFVIVIVAVLIAGGFFFPPVRNWILTRGAGVTTKDRRHS